MLKARCVVCHYISVPGDVVCYLAVPVLSLVLARIVAQVSSCSIGGDSAFRDARDCRGVVCACGYGGVPRVEQMRDERGLCQDGSVF